MRLTIDFETRSAIDLIKLGSYRYAIDESTTVLCLAIKQDDEPPRIWVPTDIKNKLVVWCAEHEQHQLPYLTIKQVRELVANAEHIEAHNALFEYNIWSFCFIKEYPAVGPLPLGKLYCSKAKAARMALPLSLNALGKALGLPQDKRKAASGKRLISTVCCPSKKDGSYDNRPGSLYDLFVYCLQDTEAEYQASKRLPELPAGEREIWLQDAAINQGGVCVDVESAQHMVGVLSEHADDLNFELWQHTDEAVDRVTKTQQLTTWLASKDIHTASIDKASVENLLARSDLPPKVRRVLEIRQELAKSSTSKIQTLIAAADPNDNRIRGLFEYHGATTGRWAGRLAQPQNLPRGDIHFENDEEWGQAAQAMAAGRSTVQMLYDDPFSLASSMIRGLLVAAPGHKLIAADYSSIEGRLLAWLADEQKVLYSYRQKRDPYKSTAAMMLHKDYDAITKEERNKFGKVAELACGYQGAVGAIRRFNGGAGLTDQEVFDQIIGPWRKARQKTVNLWGAVGQAAIAAVQTPGKTCPVANGKVAYRYEGEWLACRLPSKRSIFYYHPKIEAGQLTFWGMTSQKQWVRQDTYGGKLVENIVQAMAACILRRAIIDLARVPNLRIVLHVHDEVVVEVPVDSDITLDQICQIMSRDLDWAISLPLAASGWEGHRFKKD